MAVPGARNPFNRSQVAEAMNWTFGLSVASLVFAVLFFLLTVVALGTPVGDIGMLSTTLVFLAFGGFGLFLNKAQQAEATA